MKETENFTCNYIATKARVEHCMSGIMQDAPAEIDREIEMGPRLISFVNAAWIQSVKTTYPVALTTFSGIVFPL